MGLPSSKYPPTKSKNAFKVDIFVYIMELRVCKFEKMGMNGVAMAQNGFILWENDAARLNIFV